MEQIDLNSGRYAFRGTRRTGAARTGAHPRQGARSRSSTRTGSLVTVRSGATKGRGFVHALDRRRSRASFSFRFSQLNMARNWDEFRSGIAPLPAPSSNVVYADVDGNIGYQAAGLLPIRRTYDGDVPANGAAGEAEWDGFIPFEELPSAFNPRLGHDRHCESESISRRTTSTRSAASSRRITGRNRFEALLSKARDSSRKTCSRFRRTCIPRSRTSSRSRRWRRSTSAARRTHPCKRGADILRKWNGQMDKDEAAPLIATLDVSAAPASGGRSCIEWQRRALGNHDGQARLSNAFSAIARPSGSAITISSCCGAFIDAMEEGRRLPGARSEPVEIR